MREALLDEAAAVVHRGGVACMSRRADVLATWFSPGALESLALEAAVGGESIERTLTLKDPNHFQAYLGEQSVLLVASPILVPAGDAVMVRFQLTPSYDQVRAKLDLVAYTMDTLPHGVGLYVMNPQRDVDVIPFASNKYRALLGVSEKDHTTPGLEAVWGRVHAQDAVMSKDDIDRARRSLSHYSVSMRFMVDNEYRWMRVTANCVSLNRESVGASFVMEPVPDPHMTELSAFSSFSAFTRAVFDLTFVLDASFRFTDNSPQAAHFFTNDSAASIKGRSFGDFFKSEHDKDVFHRVLVPTLVRREADESASATMVQIQLCLASKSADVEVYAAPINAAVPVSLDTAALIRTSPTEGKHYLFGLRVLRTDACRDCKTRVPAGSEPLEDSIVTDTSPITESMLFSHTDGWTRRAYADLLRDCFESIDAAAEPGAGIIIPTFVVSDMDVLEQQLVSWLPTCVQPKFLAALDALDFRQLSSLLVHCAHGSCHLVSLFVHQEGLCSDADVLATVFRFFMSLVSSLNAQDALALLLALSEARSAAAPLLTVEGVRLVELQFALCMTSAALAHADWFCESDDWVRRSFVRVVSHRDISPISLPFVHWLCLLWAALHMTRAHFDEAAGVLQNLIPDLEAYCEQNPASVVSESLLEIAVKNNSWLSQTTSTL